MHRFAQNLRFRIEPIFLPWYLTFKHAWNGSWSSLPLITMLGKSSKCTSRGSNIPLRVTMICFGCSSTGNDLINAATSSAVFHLASWNITWIFFVHLTKKIYLFTENYLYRFSDEHFTPVIYICEGRVYLLSVNFQHIYQVSSNPFHRSQRYKKKERVLV